MERKAHEGWAILELMGHIRLAGFVTEETVFGAAMGRIDVAAPDGGVLATQYFGGNAVFRLTPTTEEVVRAAAQTNQVEPVSRWELRAIDAPRAMVEEDRPDPFDLPFD